MKLYRSFVTVGGLTLVSRVLGFVRDILFAWAFGSGWVADAFNVAFRFPNLFRRLFGEGAFNSAFLPLFAKELELNGREAGAQVRRGGPCRSCFRTRDLDGRLHRGHAVADVRVGAGL